MVSTPARSLESLNIARPTLLLDAARAYRNIERMAAKARAAGLRFRPHFKTHQSAAIGEWFRAHDVTGITVSSLDMARYFASHGWRDITVAFPANVREMAKINSLAVDIRLHLLVDTPETVAAMAEQLTHPVEVWIEVDAGDRRTGLPWDQADRVVALARNIAAAGGQAAACRDSTAGSRGTGKLTFAGLLSHSGQTYHAANRGEVKRIHAEVVGRMTALKEELTTAGVKPCEISLGDTPACSVAEDWQGVDEMRPGAFVFYDLMQHLNSVCVDEDIALAVACPVVGKYPERKQVVVYGGAVHLGKEFVLDPAGRKVFGYRAPWTGEGWGPPDTRAAVVSLSQEHGVLEVADELWPVIEIGQLLLILPVHACLTADLYREYHTLAGEVIGRRQSNDDPGEAT
jgi:D-serine deaminase-like pyridoxal phosphate-dependent protein